MSDDVKIVQEDVSGQPEEHQLELDLPPPRQLKPPLAIGIELPQLDD